MTFTPKDWRDYPDTTTPINAAALENLETRVAGYAADRSPAYSATADFAADASGGSDALAALQAAVDAAGVDRRRLIVPPGTYNLSSTLNISGEHVDIEATGATFRATNSMPSLISYNKVTEQPGVGLHGARVDMNSLAQVGLLVQDCWASDHDVRILNPAGNVGVKVLTVDSAFGAYYNRIRAQVRGSSAVGSIGVLLEGAGALTAANANVVIGTHVTNMGTGIKVGTYCDATTLYDCDCTDNTTGYDFTYGTTMGYGLWEEANATNGFIARAGAIANLFALYYEKRTAETTGVCRVTRGHGRITSANTGALDNEIYFVAGSHQDRESYDPAAGRFQWTRDGVTPAMLSVDGTKVKMANYLELAEMTAPGVAAADGARLFLRDSGAGKTQLCVIFASGAIQVLATQP